jgi:hypothetical protein
MTAVFLGNTNYSSVRVSYFLTVNDTTSPVVRDFNATPNSTAYGQNITLFANVTDNVGIANVSVMIENFNYSMGLVLGDVFAYTFNTSVYASGTYNYTIYANDSVGNDAVAVTGNFTVTKASSAIQLLLNGSRDNVTAFASESVNITALLLRPLVFENIQIYVDGILSANSSSPAVNISAYLPGLYNVTALYLGNQNYSASRETWWLNVTDGTPPVINSHNATPNSTVYGANITIFANVTDNAIVANVTVMIAGGNNSLLPVSGDVFS